MNNSINAPPVIRRTRVACKACHLRRVKCDAADGLPCMHCRTRQTPCELIESRRGKYTRKCPRKSRCRSENGSSVSPAGLPDDFELSPNDTVYVHADEEVVGAEAPLAPGVASLPAQNAGDRRPVNSGNSLTLSSIIQMVHRAKEGDFGNIHIPTQRPAPLTDNVSLQSNTDLGGPISLQDALAMPDRQVGDQLIRSFFKHFHPAYPVIDRLHFISQYKQGQASPLLLHVIYVIALTCGPETLVHIAGYMDRTAARKAHYLRAKTLYDADYETDATSLAAALHLLSFWWFGPNDQKDSWYWQGCAVTFAQSLGMHRSLARRGMSPRLISIWKRIWWSIYVRDRHVAAALGKPCRIRDEDCDVEPLSENDLIVDLGHDEELLPVQEPHHTYYFLEIAKISAILGNIVIGEFSPHPPALAKFDATSSLQSLRTWRSGLPKALCNDSTDKPEDASFWASMLDVSYQNARILLFRPKVTGHQAFPEPESDMRARMAADAITRTAEDLLAAETICYAQLHIVPSLFSALSIHTLAIGQKNAVHRQLAENKSRQCILALGELAKIWPVGMWVVKAFSNLLRRLLSRGSISNQKSQPSATTGEAIHCDHIPAANANMDSTGQHSSAFLELQVTPSSNDVPSIASEFLPCSKLSDAPTTHLFQSHIYPDYFSGATDQTAYDLAWFECLENMLDVELLQKELGMGSKSPRIPDI